MDYSPKISLFGPIVIWENKFRDFPLPRWRMITISFCYPFLIIIMIALLCLFKRDMHVVFLDNFHHGIMMNGKVQHNMVSCNVQRMTSFLESAWIKTPFMLLPQRLLWQISIWAMWEMKRNNNLLNNEKNKHFSLFFPSFFPACPSLIAGMCASHLPTKHLFSYLFIFFRNLFLFFLLYFALQWTSPRLLLFIFFHDCLNIKKELFSCKMCGIKCKSDQWKNKRQNNFL